MLKIKVEFLLPLLYDNGTEIEPRKYNETYDEISKKFKGYTIDQHPLLGNWVNDEGEVYTDESHYGVWVVCRNNPKNRTFWKKYREKLKERFDQQSIMIYFVKIYDFDSPYNLQRILDY